MQFNYNTNGYRAQQQRYALEREEQRRVSEEMRVRREENRQRDREARERRKRDDVIARYQEHQRELERMQDDLGGPFPNYLEGGKVHGGVHGDLENLQRWMDGRPQIKRVYDSPKVPGPAPVDRREENRRRALVLDRRVREEGLTAMQAANQKVTLPVSANGNSVGNYDDNGRLITFYFQSGIYTPTGTLKDSSGKIYSPQDIFP
jgi:hypothetical protein